MKNHQSNHVAAAVKLPHDPYHDNATINDNYGDICFYIQHMYSFTEGVIKNLNISNNNHLNWGIGRHSIVSSWPIKPHTIS